MIDIPENSVLLLDQQQHGKAQVDRDKQEGDKSEGRWVLFSEPENIVSTDASDQIINCLQNVEAQVARGMYAAGFLTYEAAPGVDASLQTREADTRYPLLWFGLYKRPKAFDFQSMESEAAQNEDWQASLSREEYAKDFAEIKKQIRAGNSYQINYTKKLHSEFKGRPLSLFCRLCKVQSAKYAAYVNLGRIHLCSASPELFFSFNQGTISCKPMKGTVGRGKSVESDERQKSWLRASVKNRAENLMIVDMIRNDLGKIAERGSVAVETLFDVEKYPTVLQMTSSIKAKTRLGASQVLASMFPCASITGAPKVKTMEIIKGLESEARGVYTGSMGYISPHARAQFNVAIRTVVVDKKERVAEYGVGGGITWASNLEEEYKECFTKAKILQQNEIDFELFETLYYSRESGVFLLEHHLKRLVESASYFDFTVSVEQVRADILAFVSALPGKRSIFKVQLKQGGDIRILERKTPDIMGEKVVLSQQAISSDNPFLFHKTTNREVYKQQLARHNAWDVILFNERAEITETCMANIVVKKKNRLLTPKQSSGLLNGTFRACLLEQGRISEATLYVEDLHGAEVFLINSVRGWMKLSPELAENYWRISSEFVF